MRAYLAKRLLLFPPVLLILALLSFFLVRSAPGSPFTSEKNISEEALTALRKDYGFDKPLPAQAFLYLKNLCRGYLGRSLYYRDLTVNAIIGQALPVSLKLGTFALVIALALGIPLGVLAAYRQNTGLDYAASLAAAAGISIPSFVLASLLVLALSFAWPLFPAVGWAGPRYLVLPALTLAAPYVAYISRLSRASLAEALRGDFIRGARAKGVPEARVLFVHGLKNGLLPVVSFLGPAAAGILTGGVVVEKIFAIPGLGAHFVHSALHRDYFLAIGCALVYGAFLLVFNLLSDLLYAAVDPRISYGAES